MTLLSKKYIAFVISHPYVNSFSCFREPIKYLADKGWHVDLYTSFYGLSLPPDFIHPNIQLVPIKISVAGALDLRRQLLFHRPRYSWIFAVPQWSLYQAFWVHALTGVPMACISDELYPAAEALTPAKKKWKARERKAHQACRFTLSHSRERADFIKQENQLGENHRVFVVPSSQPGPAERLVSHYYQDTLNIESRKTILLYAGSWWWRLRFKELEKMTDQWRNDTVLVFEGRYSENTDYVDRPNIRYARSIVNASLINYAVSSAHIGLALYAAPPPIQNGLIGIASAKISLYLKNCLPVISTYPESFRWLEESGCGVCVETIDQIPAAVDKIKSKYDEYVKNIKCFYSEKLDFRKFFEPIYSEVISR